GTCEGGVMEINVRAVQGITVVELTGELNWNTAPEAEKRILDESRANGKMILDLGGVTFLASAGLGMLLAVYRAVIGNGGRVALVCASEHIRKVMWVTGFLDFFKNYESLEAGIAAMAS